MHQIYASDNFEAEYTYSGTDLGSSWSREAVFFRLWAPTAQNVSVKLYESGNVERADLICEIPMTAGQKGTWVATLPGNWHGKYYTYLAHFSDHSCESGDPYAKAAGVNGIRSMILDLRSTDPEGWELDSDPNAGLPLTDAIIYETHIRDLTMDPSSGVTAKGTYSGFAERGTTLPCGLATGLDHIRALGVTHIQLQPVCDFGSVDEADASRQQYNWGYDPVNYNLPEGSYASDPCHGETRVREFKQMIQAIHRAGLSVVMDVVYNHVYKAEHFSFNKLVPEYFSRPGSNGSGCGNDTATERSMVRKFIADSVFMWAEEYHIDGFRFDLAGLIDTQTIQFTMDTVHKAYPHVHFYGEGWCMEPRLTKENFLLANQQNSALLPRFAFFNDTFRDLLRGSVFDTEAKGFLTEGTPPRDMLNSCFMGVTPWACSPAQSVNYISCHDNHTLFDRLKLALPEAPDEEIACRCRLGGAFMLLSQGIPFLLAGEEMLRSKETAPGKYDSNSYRSPDSVNAIKWSSLQTPEVRKTIAYYKGLICLRKKFSCLRLTERDDVLSNIRPLPAPTTQTAVYRVRGETQRILLIFHGGKDEITYPLPDGQWFIYTNAKQAGDEPFDIAEHSVSVPGLSCCVLVQPKPAKIVDVVAAMIWDNGKFLICQRPRHKSRGLLWEFVGGKTEEGESPSQALIRECREELGVTVAVGEKCAQVLHQYPDIHIRLTLFRCAIAEGPVTALEHEALRWISPDEITDYTFCPADQELLKEIYPMLDRAF